MEDDDFDDLNVGISENEHPKTRKHNQQEVEYVRKGAIPWDCKYRPRKLENVVQQDDVKKMLQTTVKNGNLPNLLFYGPPGVGKTSTIFAIANELFGPKIFNQRVMALNASDDRGINSVRIKITNYAKKVIGTSDPNYPSPPYKIIILDEADAMTQDAQLALRIPIEKYARTTRFCFICNYVNKIIEPIASRCLKLRFKPIDEEHVSERLQFIAKNEMIEVDEDITRLIAKLRYGDIRMSIQTLQGLSYIYKMKHKVSINDVYKITGNIPNTKLTILWDGIIFGKDITVANLQTCVVKLLAKSYPIRSIVEGLLNRTVIEKRFDDVQKSVISLHIGETLRKISDGADEEIQLLNILTYIRGVVTEVVNFVSESIF